MDKKLDRENKLKLITEILEKEGAETAYLFGSFARNEESEKSDIDIIVKFRGVKGLLDLARIEREITEKIGIKADLQTENSISPHIEPYIRDEKVALLK
jgi:uncharacterized protein